MLRVGNEFFWNILESHVLDKTVFRLWLTHMKVHHLVFGLKGVTIGPGSNHIRQQHFNMIWHVKYCSLYYGSTLDQMLHSNVVEAKTRCCTLTWINQWQSDTVLCDNPYIIHKNQSSQNNPELKLISWWSLHMIAHILWHIPLKEFKKAWILLVMLPNNAIGYSRKYFL